MVSYHIQETYKMDQQTINLLIKRSIDGDSESFRKLVESFQHLVYATSFRLLCDDFEAEEATQETFIKIWKNLHRFNGAMRFSTWLYKITVNHCYDKIKTGKRYQSKFQTDPNSALLLNLASLENIENTLINNELAKIILSLTHELTPRQKLVFTLVELENLPVEEISTITGLSPGKIKSNLYCARQSIKEKLIHLDKIRGKYNE
jgi:RNA polymerase sigma-70 factor, ECF subfamily